MVPFTPSHAVVAFAFRGAVLPASAVAIGSMTPDLPLFLPFLSSYGFTHDLRWVAVTTVLAGGLWAIWFFWIAPAVADLSAAWLARRYVPRPRIAGDLRAVVGVVSALLIGVLSHLVWDSFTHADRWGSNHVGLLRREVNGQPIWSVLQEVSSVVGILAIVVWFSIRTRRPLSTESRQRVRTLRLGTSVLVVVALLISVGIGVVTGGPLWRVFYSTVTTAGVLVGLVVCAGVAGWWYVDRRDRAAAAARG